MIALWLALAAGAHPLAPSVLRLDQQPNGVRAVWRTPRIRPVGPQPVPILPCDPIGPAAIVDEEQAVELHWTLACADLAHQEVRIEGLEAGGPNALVEWRVGEATEALLLTAAEPRATLGGSPDARGTPLRTVRMGIGHLLGGADHVLFVCGLVLGVPFHRLLGAITAFTLGHGVSLALAGWGWLTLPPAPVEVAIALSLVWLAAELLGTGESILARRPAVICLPVGLVHGLGFAGAWLESGLAKGATAEALLGFNLGIELGQLALLAGIWAALEWLGPPSERTRRALAWVGGAIAAMWVWERALAMLG